MPDEQYKFHTADLAEDLDTKEGKKLTAQMVEISKNFNLSYTYGHSPESQSRSLLTV